MRDSGLWFRVETGGGRWSGQGGQCTQLGGDLGKPAIAGREPRGQLASVADQPTGMAMNRRRTMAALDVVNGMSGTA
jgi:hypothetical protein